MQCGYCVKDMVEEGLGHICYNCGEIHCPSCLNFNKKVCSNCDYKFIKMRTYDYEIEKIENILIKNPKHKNIGILSSILSIYYLRKENIKWYSYALKAANSGIGSDQYLIGNCYFYGFEDVDVDYDKAHHWFMLAAENKHSIALQFLSYMYHHGVGVEKDIERSKTFDVLFELYKLK